MTLADQLFAVRAEYRAIGERVQDALLAALGTRVDALEIVPYGPLEYDDDERTWTLLGAPPGWEPTQAQVNAACALGFRGGWVRYVDGSELGFEPEPKEVG